jgi:hypothetical protein
MRLQLAKARIAEAREMRLAEIPPATLIMTVERLENTCEDLVAMLENCWSEAS